MVDRTVVAFTGFKGSGKTTLAEFLVTEFGFKRMSFADPIRQACKSIFALTDEQMGNRELKEKEDPRWGLSPRQIMQRFGTEVGREFQKDIWVKSLFHNMGTHSAIVIDDCRFPNEADAIKTWGGYVIGVVRPGYGPSNHASELSMRDNWSSMVDTVIENDSDLDTLWKKCISTYSNYIDKRTSL